MKTVVLVESWAPGIHLDKKTRFFPVGLLSWTKRGGESRGDGPGARLDTLETSTRLS